MSVSSEVVEVVEEVPSEDRPVRPEQMVRLRRLADERGESFTYPHTEDEAAAEIGRLEGRRAEDPMEAWIDRHEVSRGMDHLGRDAASVRRSEITGYGSHCHWRHSQR